MLQKITNIRVPNILRHKSMSSVQDIRLRTLTGPDFIGVVETTIYQSDCASPEVDITSESSKVIVKICLPERTFDIVKKLRLLKISEDNKSYKSTSTVVESVEKLESGIEAMGVVNKVVSTDKKLSFNVYVDDEWFLSNDRERHCLYRRSETYVTESGMLPFFGMFHNTIGAELLGTFSDRFKDLIEKRIELFTDLYDRSAAAVDSSTQGCLSHGKANISEANEISKVVTSLGEDKALRITMEKRVLDHKKQPYFGLYSFGTKIENFTRTYSAGCNGSISETAHRIKKLPSNFLEAANNYLALSHSDRAILAEKLLSVLLLIDKKMDEYISYVHENNVSEFKTTLAFIEQVLSK